MNGQAYNVFVSYCVSNFKKNELRNALGYHLNYFTIKWIYSCTYSTVVERLISQVDIHDPHMYSSTWIL